MASAMIGWSSTSSTVVADGANDGVVSIIAVKA
jgi:hypothetical protein